MGIRQVPPSIKDPNLAGFLRELRAAIGGVSDQVTKLVQTRSSSGGGGTDPGTNPPDPGKPPVGDGYPPPAPTSLQAIPAAFSVTLVWTNPVIPDLQATEVWGRRSFAAWNSTYEYLANAKVLVNGKVYRSKRAQYVNPTNNVVTLNKNFPPATSPDWWEATTLAPTDKSKVGESAGTSWIHDKLTPGETWAYWVRNRDIENLFSTYYPDDDVGVITTTLLDPGAYLDLLTNSITATQLYRDLGARINLIDGPLTIAPSCSIAGHTTEAACKAAGGTWNPGSVAYRVAEEASARANGLAAEALARETGITNESTIRRTQDEQLASTISTVNAKADNAAAAVISEQTARVNADGALGKRIDSVVATAAGNTAAITSESTARANADGALSTRIDSVVATTNSNTAAIQTETNARTTADSALSQRIDVVVAKADTNAAAITAEQTARANADGALATSISQVQAVANVKVSVFFQTASPSTTGRTAGDLWYDTDDNNKQYRWDGSAWAVYRDSAKTYSQTTAPTNTTATPLYPGDIWVDTTSETVNGQSVPRNKTYRWSGATWVDVSNGPYSEAKASALITNFENAKIGYCTVGGLTTDYDDQTTCQNNGGVWHQGLPWAAAVKQVSVSDGATTGSIEQKFTAQRGELNTLNLQYTVKLDSNGWVSGFGLASTTQSDGTVISDFGIRADRFWIAPPTSPGRLEDLGVGLNEIGATRLVIRTGQFRLAAGAEYAWYAYVQAADVSELAVNQFMTLKHIRATDTTTTANLHGQYNGAFLIAAVGQRIVYGLDNNAVDLFNYGATVASRIVIFRTDSNLGQGFTTSQTSGEFNDPARLVSSRRLPFIVTTTSRTYNGQTIDPGVYINAAYIVDASITNAKIYGDIRSIDYDGEEAGGSGYGNAGWCINKLGRATFNNAVFRGDLVSSVSGSPTFDSAGNITSNGTAGWAITHAGNAVFNTAIVRSGANVSANALSWAKFYNGLTNDDNSVSTSFTVSASAGAITTMCWTPYQQSGYSPLVAPNATSRTTTIVCSLTVETPTKKVGNISSGQYVAVNPTTNQITMDTGLWLGSTDGVWLDLMSAGSVFQTVVLFEANTRDILARFFSSQGAFTLTASQAASLSNPHIRVRVRHTNTGGVTYDNVRLFVQSFVS